MEVCDRIGRKYGIPVTNKRLALSPVSHLVAGHGEATAVEIAKTLDEAAAACRIDLVGGFTALVHKGITPADAIVIGRCRSAVGDGARCVPRSTWPPRRAGINMDAVARMGERS